MGSRTASFDPASQAQTQQMTTCNARSNDRMQTGNDVVDNAMLEHEPVLPIRIQHRNASIIRFPSAARTRASSRTITPKSSRQDTLDESICSYQTQGKGLATNQSNSTLVAITWDCNARRSDHVCLSRDRYVVKPLSHHTIMTCRTKQSRSRTPAETSRACAHLREPEDGLGVR